MIILSPIFNFSALDIPRKNGDRGFKFHSSLRLLMLFAFLGSFRFLSSVDGKEKDHSLKLYLPFGREHLKTNTRCNCLWLDYRMHTYTYAENPKIGFYMDFADISLIVFALTVKNR